MLITLLNILFFIKLFTIFQELLLHLLVLTENLIAQYDIFLIFSSFVIIVESTLLLETSDATA